MTYTRIQRFIPVNKYSKKAPYTMSPTSITVHNTANDASAENEVKYMTNNNNATSFHVAIDEKEVIEAIPFNRNAFAAGDGANGKGNRTSIHIEICYSKSGGQRYVEAEENAVQYIAHVLHDKGWGVDRVKQHYDWSRKNCPHRIRDEGRWQSFIARVQQALNKLKGFNASIRTPTPAQDVSSKIGYSNVDGANTFRIQSGVYNGKGDAAQALKDAQATAEDVIASGKFGWVTIIGYKE